MKAFLQLNLDSNFNKNYYRIKRNKLEITRQNPPIQYAFDNISFSPKDTIDSLVYDLIIDYSQKIRIMSQPASSESINVNNSIRKITSVPPSLKEQSLYSMSVNLIEENFREPQISYTIIFDQITATKPIQTFIKLMSSTQMFKNEKIRIGHFLTHQNGVYDFHKKHVILSETERQQLDKQYLKLHGSIQENFMWVYNKEVNLCEQVKLNSITSLIKSLSYISAEQFNQLSQPTLGVQLVSNLTKAEEIQHKQLQNKKILQFFIVNIGSKLRLVIVLFNFNKSYSLSWEEQKELTQLYMMYGVVAGEIKYQSIKIEILNRLLRNCEKLYYVMYFPGPRLTNQMIQNSGTKRQKQVVRGGKSKQKERGTSQHFRKEGTLKNDSKILGMSRVSRMQSPQKTDRVIEAISSTFQNYTSLKAKDKDSLQKIIKEYLVKKEDNLKIQLDKVKQRVKELKLSQRIEECEVNDLKTKCMKALEKMSQSIIELQKMGITNVERHMDWLKLLVDDKKQQIKETQEQIEQINKKTIESRKSHCYYYSKMVDFRDKLKMKQMEILKKRTDVISKTPIEEQKQNDNQSYLNHLSLSQLEQIEQHKEKQKSKLIQKLKNSMEKKQFFDALNEIRSKVSKLQLTRIEQKYFDLLHD